jgi:hypothetical protein
MSVQAWANHLTNYIFGLSMSLEFVGFPLYYWHSHNGVSSMNRFLPSLLLGTAFEAQTEADTNEKLDDIDTRLTNI